VADADDLEGLHERNACCEHGRKLSRENRDIARGRFAARPEQRALLADLRRNDVLTAQVGAGILLADRENTALDLVALLSLPSQVNGTSLAATAVGGMVSVVLYLDFGMLTPGPISQL
jgi:hypothetical protein